MSCKNSWWDTKEGERTTTQTPTLPFTPNPSFKKPKNLKPNILFFFFSTNSDINPGQPAGKERKKKKKKTRY
jgi:hypothetical protein